MEVVWFCQRLMSQLFIALFFVEKIYRLVNVSSFFIQEQNEGVGSVGELHTALCERDLLHTLGFNGQ